MHILHIYALLCISLIFWYFVMFPVSIPNISKKSRILSALFIRPSPEPLLHFKHQTPDITQQQNIVLVGTALSCARAWPKYRKISVIQENIRFLGWRSLTRTARFPVLNIFVFGCLLLPHRRIIDLLWPRRRVVSLEPKHAKVVYQS